MTSIRVAKYGLWAAALMLLLSAASLAFGQASAPASEAASTQQASAENSSPMLRGSFPATVIKPLDSKKLKAGDVVILQISAPVRARGVLIPTGSKLIGHITQAQARSKGDSESSLGMVFDKIEVTNGKEMPMQGVLQAVAPSLGPSGPDTASMMGSGQMMAGRGGSDTMPPPDPNGVAGPDSGIHPINVDSGPHPVLLRDSLGVLGFKNLEMDKNGVLTSSGKEVKLENGTQMMVRAEIQIPVQ